MHSIRSLLLCAVMATSVLAAPFVDEIETQPTPPQHTGKTRGWAKPKQPDFWHNTMDGSETSIMPTTTDTPATTVGPRPWCKFWPEAPICMVRSKSLDTRGEPATDTQIQPTAAIDYRMACQNDPSLPVCQVSNGGAGIDYGVICKFHPELPVCNPRAKAARDALPVATAAHDRRFISQVTTTKMIVPLKTVTLCPATKHTCETFTVSDCQSS